jgi:hypothetical protein
MFKKTITFKDFNGNQKSQDFYFHMSKGELLELAADGNAMVERIKRIIAANDGKAVLKEFRELIWQSVGIRSEDGSCFVKGNEAKRNLFESPAYDELLMELCTDANAGAEFVRQLIPEKMQEEMKAQLTKLKTHDETVDPFKQTTENDPRPIWMKEERNPTQEELRNMSAEELRQAFQLRR